MFQAFVKCVGIYPVGSLVRLESGLLAVVIDNQGEALLTPTVKAFYCTRRRERIVPRVFDLARLAGRDKIRNWESPSNWPFRDLDELWSGQPTRH